MSYNTAELYWMQPSPFKCYAYGKDSKQTTCIFKMDQIIAPTPVVRSISYSNGLTGDAEETIDE
jgi:hypothetical protein